MIVAREDFFQFAIVANAGSGEVRCLIEYCWHDSILAPTVAELALLAEKAHSHQCGAHIPDETPAPAVAQPELEANAPEVAAKASYREFYNDVTRRLEQSGVGAASFFLNHGYVSVGGGDEARFEVPPQVFNRNSVRLASELIGSTQLHGRRVLDVGCGRGGTVALLAETFGGVAPGVDLSPEAIAFCRKTHGHAAQFQVGDGKHRAFEDAGFDVVTNMESSHSYPNLRAFFAEATRVLWSGGIFLYTDLLPVERWAEVQVLLPPLGFRIQSERDITAGVLASCDRSGCEPGQGVRRVERDDQQLPGRTQISSM